MIRALLALALVGSIDGFTTPPSVARTGNLVVHRFRPSGTISLNKHRGTNENNADQPAQNDDFLSEFHMYNLNGVKRSPFGMADNAEIWNGRVAMLSFLWVFIQESGSGKGVLRSLWENDAGAAESLGVFILLLGALTTQFLNEPWEQDVQIRVSKSKYESLQKTKPRREPDLHALEFKNAPLRKEVVEHSWDPDRRRLNLNEMGSPYGFKKNAEVWNGRVAMLSFMWVYFQEGFQKKGMLEGIHGGDFASLASVALFALGLGWFNVFLAQKMEQDDDYVTRGLSPEARSNFRKRPFQPQTSVLPSEPADIKIPPEAADGLWQGSFADSLKAMTRENMCFPDTVASIPAELYFEVADADGPLSTSKSAIPVAEHTGYLQSESIGTVSAFPSVPTPKAVESKQAMDSAYMRNLNAYSAHQSAAFHPAGTNGAMDNPYMRNLNAYSSYQSNALASTRQTGGMDSPYMRNLNAYSVHQTATSTPTKRVGGMDSPHMRNLSAYSAYQHSDQQTSSAPFEPEAELNDVSESGFVPSTKSPETDEFQGIPSTYLNEMNGAGGTPSPQLPQPALHMQAGAMESQYMRNLNAYSAHLAATSTPAKRVGGMDSPHMRNLSAYSAYQHSDQQTSSAPFEPEAELNDVSESGFVPSTKSPETDEFQGIPSTYLNEMNGAGAGGTPSPQLSQPALHMQAGAMESQYTRNLNAYSAHQFASAQPPSRSGAMDSAYIHGLNSYSSSQFEAFRPHGPPGAMDSAYMRNLNAYSAIRSGVSKSSDKAESVDSSYMRNLHPTLKEDFDATVEDCPVAQSFSGRPTTHVVTQDDVPAVQLPGTLIGAPSFAEQAPVHAETQETLQGVEEDVFAHSVGDEGPPVLEESSPLFYETAFNQNYELSSSSSSQSLHPGDSETAFSESINDSSPLQESAPELQYAPDQHNADNYYGQQAYASAPVLWPSSDVSLPSKGSEYLQTLNSRSGWRTPTDDTIGRPALDTPSRTSIAPKPSAPRAGIEGNGAASYLQNLHVSEDDFPVSYRDDQPLKSSLPMEASFDSNTISNPDDDSFVQTSRKSYMQILGA